MQNDITFQYLCELDKMLEVGDLGIVSVKPFSKFIGSPYEHEVWDMRLLNAGELEEIFVLAGGFTSQITQEHLQKQKLEMFIRSVVKRNGIPLVSQDVVDKYNSDNKVVLTRLEFLRRRVINLEQHVLNAFDVQYEVLIAKQTNYIRGFVVCNNCNNILSVNEQGMSEVKNFDEVDYCSSCTDREEIIAKLAEEIEGKVTAENSSALTGENLLNLDTNLGDK